MSRQKILVVDDSIQNLQLLAGVLENEYDVQFATSGREALLLAAEEMPDLVVLDIMMDGMDGYETCERLKQLSNFNDCPIVFLTALDDETSEARGLALGAADFLTKPFNITHVRLRLRNLLQRVALTRMLEEERERLSITLYSIGDGVITTDENSNVMLMNGVAEQLTGWLHAEAVGKPLDQVLNIVHQQSRRVLQNPAERALAEQRIVGLPNHTLLLSRNGGEYMIEDSTAPIRSRDGTIVGAVVVFHDATEQRRKIEEAFAFNATHDPLTGLLNSTEFNARLNRALSTAQEGMFHTLLLIDLDQFRLINDACGHAVGDRVLQNIATLIESCIRSGDTLARLGGDEFAVLMEHCPARPAQTIAESVCDRLDNYRFIHDQHRFRIGASIGLVEINESWGSSSDILQAGDTACRTAKESGRNRVHAYFSLGENIVKEKQGAANWAGKIDAAMENDRFILYAQRIEPLQPERHLPSYEVLLRLRDDDGKLVPPGLFIPAAERYHMAGRLDRWVVEKTLALLSAVPSLHGIDKICINLSGQSVGDKLFHKHLETTLRESSVDMRKICFEVTETSAVGSIEDAIYMMTRLKELGVRFSLDDFGSGVSSFAYLKALPVDFLKIDGHFIRYLPTDPVDMATVRCIADMASLLHKETVAEFVETEAARQTLREFGVDYAQGYLVHKPEPLNVVLGLPDEINNPQPLVSVR
ncbi:MAG: EAL domain-containing protein [Rhodocyclaceae bacterium]|nr:EAL domain-containing protein [Rhodocyclaceae bacterium]